VHNHVPQLCAIVIVIIFSTKLQMFRVLFYQSTSKTLVQMI